MGLETHLGGGDAGFGVFGWGLVDKHRRSPIVKNWRPSNYPTEQYGQLAAQAFGEATHTTLLLHGLGATSDYWSFRYDALAAVGSVVAPDLLGFGDSLDMTRTSAVALSAK